MSPPSAPAWGCCGGVDCVEQEHDRFGLPICHVNAYRELLLQHLQLGGALGTMSDWLLAKDPTSDQARSAIGGAVNAIGYAAEHGQWGAVVRLVKVLEPILTLAGRWEAARDVLNQGLAAARQLGDEPAGAWLSHQLGTLEVSQDELAQGQAHLEEALRLREQLQDHAGAAVSRHNLEVLDAPVIQDWEPPRGGAGSASGCGGSPDGGRYSPAGRRCSASRSCSGSSSFPAA